MNLYKLYKNYKKNKNLRTYQSNLDLAKESIYENTFSVKIYEPDVAKINLKVGRHCIIGAKFVCEGGTGEIIVGDRTQISGGTTIISKNKVTIEDDVTIAGGCLFYDHNSHSVLWSERKDDIITEYNDYIECGDPLKNKNWDVVKSKPIIVSQKAWIGFGVTILKGVTVGEGAVIAAKSVVVKDVEPYTIVGGNPATFIKRIGE